MELYRGGSTMKGQKKYQIIASFLLILSVFVFTEIKAESFPGGKDRIIEVCSEGIVYVPYGTKIVKCNGKVKRVIRITPYDSSQREGGSCICWNCCGGVCAIIIACDPEPGEFSDSDSSAKGLLCAIWLECD